jgi:hypothetical protein
MVPSHRGGLAAEVGDSAMVRLTSDRDFLTGATLWQDINRSAAAPRRAPRNCDYPHSIVPIDARVLILMTALTLTLGACGEQRGSAMHTVPEPLPRTALRTPAPTIATIEVPLIGFRLPRDPQMVKPGTIAFVATNDGELRHALAVDGPAGEIRTPALRPGEQATIALRLPRGTYRWYCPIGDHARRGMVGRVRVAE